MTQNKNHPPSKREYPAIYEKVVPIALLIIGITVIVLLLITFAVAFGFF